LSNQAIVATTGEEGDENIYGGAGQSAGPIKRVPLQKLAEESKKLGVGYQ
jgi:hypothetical protein